MRRPYAGLGGAVALATIMLGCSSSTPVAHPASNPRSTVPAAQYRAPLAALKRGDLLVENGASSISIVAADLGGDLYRASIDDPADQLAITVGLDGQVDIRTVGNAAQPHVVIQISTRLPWGITVRGGTTQTTFDLTGLRLDALDAGGGAENMTIVLPSPSGVVPVTVTGGTTTLNVRVPAAVPMRITVTGGIGTLRMYGSTETGPVAPRVFTEGAFAGARDAYAVALQGGSSVVSIQPG